MKLSKQKICKFFKSFTYAIGGLKYCFKTEFNFRVHICAMIVIFILSYLFHISKIEFLFVLTAVTTVLISELVNTAVERVCNLITTQYNKDIKIIKDLCASIVLVCAISSVILGIAIFAPKIISLI